MARKIRWRVHGLAGRLFSTVMGLAGGVLLYSSLAPVLLSGRNADVIAEWRDLILQWTQLTGYLRLGFVGIALIFIGIGLLGVIINLFKPISGQKYMMWGGIASLSFLTVLWLDLLELHAPLLGSTDYGSNLIRASNWGITNWAIFREPYDFISNLFGGGWLKPAFVGALLLLFSGLPRWWSRLK